MAVNLNRGGIALNREIKVNLFEKVNSDHSPEVEIKF